MTVEKRSRPLRWLDLLLLLAVASMLSAAAFLAIGRWWAATALATAAVGAGCLVRLASRRNPEPMPHAMRWVLLLPRGHSPRRLLTLLQPRPGERILEVGPGIGVHAIPVARALSPGGRLFAVDLQGAMLDDLARRAWIAGANAISTQWGNAEHLPYADQSFDAAYLICVLGEIPNRSVAFAELRRVLKQEGRLVIGEMAADPDFISQGELSDLAEDAFFKIERVLGSGWCYLTRLRPHLPVKLGGSIEEGEPGDTLSYRSSHH